MENDPVTTATTANLKRTSAVPSLTRLSPSMIAIARRGTPKRRAIEVAASGSVGETTGPGRKATGHERPITGGAAAATATIVSATSPIASSEIGRRLLFRSRRPVLNAAE